MRCALISLVMSAIALPSIGMTQAINETRSPVPGSRQASVVAILPIRGPIDAVTTASVRQRLEEAARRDADAVVLELDTPGGELMATLELTNLIRTTAPPNTVAWIHPHAFSAGTIIALSAREIVTSPHATFGDAAPVTGLGPIPAAERAKIESPLLAELIDEARRHHYDERLVQAFVSVGIELWLLRDPATGEVVFVDRAEYAQVFGEDPQETLTTITPPESDEPFAVSPLISLLSGLQPESTLTEDGIESTPLLPPIRAPLTTDDRDRFEVLGQVVSNDRLLTLKPWQAEAYGLSAGIVANDDELKDFLGASTIFRLEPTWSTSLVKVLMSWPVRVACIAIFVLCMMIEMAFPGTGWFGLGGAAALAVLLGSPMLIGAASWWDLAAIILGVALIAVEILIIPGTIVAGLCGAVLLLLGLVGTVMSGDLTAMDSTDQFVRGGLIVLTGVGIGWAGAWRLMRHLEGSGKSRSIILEPEPTPATPTQSLVGLKGTALTDLRPSGVVDLNGTTIDAVCSGRWIEAGTTVMVTRDGIVKEVEPCA